MAESNELKALKDIINMRRHVCYDGTCHYNNQRRNECNLVMIEINVVGQCTNKITHMEMKRREKN